MVDVSWSDGIALVALLGLLGSGWVILRGSAAKASREAAEDTLHLVQENRDEWRAKAQRLEDEVDKANIKIESLDREVERLTLMITRRADIETLGATITTQHEAILEAVKDVKELVGGKRGGDHSKGSGGA